ncbi:unnamed protein product, partial [marine sediment metagenome]
YAGLEHNEGNMGSFAFGAEEEDKRCGTGAQ